MAQPGRSHWPRAQVQQGPSGRQRRRRQGVREGKCRRRPFDRRRDHRRPARGRWHVAAAAPHHPLSGPARRGGRQARVSGRRRSRTLPHTPVILAHGGAGARIVTLAQLACLADALSRGYTVLRRGGHALDAVETTTRFLESSGHFNAGTGAHLQLDGIRRMDAALMEGRTLKAGAVAGIEAVRHPISAARLVMEKTAHVLLIGPHATRFARHFKLDRQAGHHRRSAQASARRNALREAVTATGPQRRMLHLYKAIFSPLSHGPLHSEEQRAPRRGQGEGETVGAVALDRRGTLAAGTSTGGIAYMLPGRVGDSPLIGCGIYADNEAGAVSMTGLGESIIRIAVAKEITDRMALGASPTTATRLVLEKLDRRIRKVEGFGAAGALVLAPDGHFAIRHTTPRMCAGYWTGAGQPVVADRFR